MAKSKDMYENNYTKLRAIEEGEAVNWATLYIENLKERAATTMETRGATIIHAHLRALAEVAPKDLEIGKAKEKGII